MRRRRAGSRGSHSPNAAGTSFTHITAAGSAFSLTGNSFPFFVFHLNIPAREFNVQVENADGSFVHPVFNYADEESFLPRNSTATGFFTLPGTAHAPRTTGTTSARSSRTAPTCSR